MRPLKIAITADPFIPVPPVNYGGIERIIHFLAEGLKQRGHEVILVAHHESDAKVDIVPYPVAGSHLKNIITVNKLRSFKPDVIHSFSRLAYLLPFLTSTIPKLMSYQREPTISQVKKAVLLARNNTLSFTGCSDYISNQIKPFASAYTVYNGVNMDIYQVNNKVEEDAPLIFLGRIEHIKGAHIAVEVASKSKHKLIIAGNIPKGHQAYFDEQIKPFLNDEITYVGPVNDQQKNELLRTAKAFLMPILWNEPFGIVMAEAMACGTPVIGFDRGSVPEVVKHGLNGFSCENTEEMIELVNHLSCIDRKEVRKDAETKFSSDVIIDEYLTIYKKLLEKNRN